MAEDESGIGKTLVYAADSDRSLCAAPWECCQIIGQIGMSPRPLVVESASKFETVIGSRALERPPGEIHT